MPLFNGRRTLVMLCLVLLQACESSVKVTKADKVTPTTAGTAKGQDTSADDSGSNSGSTVATPPAVGTWPGKIRDHHR
jgi:major membrane immunogen (membrane-anchored lipoprotein)